MWLRRKYAREDADGARAVQSGGKERVSVKSSAASAWQVVTSNST